MLEGHITPVSYQSDELHSWKIWSNVSWLYYDPWGTKVLFLWGAKWNTISRCPIWKFIPMPHMTCHEVGHAWQYNPWGVYALSSVAYINTLTIFLTFFQPQSYFLLGTLTYWLELLGHRAWLMSVVWDSSTAITALPLDDFNPFESSCETYICDKMCYASFTPICHQSTWCTISGKWPS